MSKNIWVVLGLILVVAVAGWYLLQGQKNYSTSPVLEAEIKENTVVITNDGFALQNVSIKAGESVTWVNNDSESHTVNSVPHPAHGLYSLLNIGVLKPGDSKSLAFTTKGVYKYHDHLNPSLTGMVTVE